MEEEKSLGWIWMEQSDNRPLSKSRIVNFRKTVILDELTTEMIIDISADAKYKLYINNQLINVGPQKGDGNIHYYDRLNVTKYLRLGTNVFFVKVLAIPNKHNQGNHGFHRTDTPGLYINGYMMLKKKIAFIGNQDWKCCVSKVELVPENPYFAPLQIFEKALGDINELGMYPLEVQKKNWENVKVYEGHELPPILRPNSMVQRSIPLLFLNKKQFDKVQCIRQSSVSIEDWNKMLSESKKIYIPPFSKEIVEISAGEEVTGYLKFALNKGAKATINILTSESYAYEPREGFGDYVMPLKGDRTDHINGKLYGFVDTYQVEGYGTENISEVYEQFWFRTFRYIQLTIETEEEPITISEFTYLNTGYPLDVTTNVSTSDKSLEDIWDISERTLRLCMHETYEDCPFYEQLQYAMDSRSQILYTYAVSADDRLARACMDDFRRATRHDGMINCSYPNYETNVIPSFAIYYIAMVYDHMMYFGDKKLVMEHLSTILGVLNFYRKHLDVRGLVGKIGGPIFQDKYWSFIDWTPEWQATAGVPLATQHGPITMESLLYVMGLEHASALLKYIGYEDMANSLQMEAKKAKNAINSYCRGKTGMYTDGPGIEQYSQHTQVFAILTDTVSVEKGAAYLEETLNKPEVYAQCSVAMMFYLFRALEKCDLYKRTHELWDLWRDMLRKNLTTCEEDNITSRSDCHAWGALALFELPTIILGVHPAMPGYETLLIKPVCGSLKWAKGEVITPKGKVQVSWHKKGNEMSLEAVIPEGMNYILDDKKYTHIKIERYTVDL